MHLFFLFFIRHNFQHPYGNPCIYVAGSAWTRHNNVKIRDLNHRSTVEMYLETSRPICLSYEMRGFILYVEYILLTSVSLLGMK